MANFASLRGPVGMNRVFVRAGARARLPRLARGAQGGPHVRDQRPAARLHARRARDRRRDRAAGARPDARGEGQPALDRPVEQLEIVSNGAVVATDPARVRRHPRGRHGFPARSRRARWFTLRAWSAGRASSPSSTSTRSRRRARSTSTVGGAADPQRRGRRATSSRGSRAWRRPRRPTRGWNDEREKAEVLGRLAAAKAVFQQRADEAVRQP